LDAQGYEYKIETQAGRLEFTVWDDAFVAVFRDLPRATLLMQDSPYFGRRTGTFNMHFFLPSLSEAAHVLGTIRRILV
jgi:hypothetical protein